jgi:hypothetical protein
MRLSTVYLLQNRPLFVALFHALTSKLFRDNPLMFAIYVKKSKLLDNILIERFVFKNPTDQKKMAPRLCIRYV